MAGFDDFEIGLLRGTNFANVVTLGKDGSPQVTMVWIDVDPEAGHVLFNTAVGRAKDVNLRRDPRIALLVQDGADAYRYVAIGGRVVERVTGEEAERHIDFLNRKYHDGQPWTYQPGQVRVLYRVRPDRISRYGA
jgi:PPOX class probable F420-dependent enzyme